MIKVPNLLQRKMDPNQPRGNFQNQDFLMRRMQALESALERQNLVIRELKRENRSTRDEAESFTRDTALLKEIIEDLSESQTKSRGRLEEKVRVQEERGVQVEKALRQGQAVESQEMAKVKAVLHQKVVQDKGVVQQQREKARILFQEVTRLGQALEEVRSQGENGRAQVDAQLAQLRGMRGEQEKR